MALSPAAVFGSRALSVISAEDLKTMGHMMFKLHINTGTMGTTQGDVRKEIVACLRRVADAIESGNLSSPSIFHPNKILCSQGFDCGRFFMKRETD